MSNGGFRTSTMRIELDDLSRPQVHALLREHLQGMHALSPPQSVHALDIESLRSPEIAFWSAWDGAQLLGCGALKALGPSAGEVKSMRTAADHRRKGVARAILDRIIEEARRRSYECLWLETGSAAAFAPAQQLYAGRGFEYCAPFGDYVEDPHSVFMTRAL
jgi:putative acetyltransferase